MLSDLKKLSKELRFQFLNKNPEIDHKKMVNNKKEFVLKTDIFSQNSLMELSKKYHPDSNIISEELDNYEDISSDFENIVIMDPLDGTHNYLYGLPMWGFSYSVFSKFNIPVESYISLPMLDTLLVYKNGETILYRLDSDDYSENIKTELSDKPLSQMMIAFDNQFNKDPIIMKKNYNLLVDNVFTTRISGSAVFDIAMIITKNLDARIWHSTEIYDIAPVHAFLNKSGEVLNLNTGQGAILTDKAIIASTNNDLFNQLQKIGFKKE